MRFGVYRGAQGGIGKAMQAFTGGGNTEQSAYDDSLGKYADIEYRRAGADKYRSEAALNQQTFGAGEDLRQRSIAGTLRGIVPEGVDQTAYVTGYMASPNRSFADFTKGGQNLTGGIASQAALLAADAGDVDALNRFNSVAKPGTQYSPYSLNETGLLHGATGQHQYTPGHQALVNQRNAAAGASNADARASDALAAQRQYLEVAPGASLYDVGGGIAGMLPGADAPPPVQPGASITGMLPDVEPAGIATPGAGPQPAGVAQPMAQPFQMAGGPRLVATAPTTPSQQGAGVDKTALREAAKIQEAMRLYGMNEADATALARGWKRVVRDEVSGQTFIVDLATGKETALRGANAPGQPAGAPQPGATPGDGRPALTPLWDQTEGVSGAMPAVKAALSGPASQVLGPEAAASGLIESRQNFTNAKNDLMRAMSVNPRFPVGELQRLEREINIEPNAWDSDTTLRSKMVAVDRYLRNRLNTERAALSDPNLPAEERKAAASAARNIENFLSVMGVPANASAGQQQGGLPVTQITDDAGYDALPSGARFVGPDGVLRVKP